MNTTASMTGTRCRLASWRVARLAKWLPLLLAAAPEAGAQVGAREGASAVGSLDMLWSEWRPELTSTAPGTVLSSTQIAAPVAMRFGNGQRVSLDVSAAYALSQVTMRDSSGGTRTMRLDGPTDIRVLGTATAFGDYVAILVGGTIPVGRFRLSAEELSALAVVGAPAVGSPVPVFGAGASLTSGLVTMLPLSRGWTVALGAGLEQREAFAPFEELIVGTPVDSRLQPGRILHMTGALDGTVAGTAISLDVNVRQFTADSFAVTTPAGLASSVYRLGAVSSAALRVVPSGRRARDVVLSATAQIRQPFEDRRLGRVDGSGATFVGAGAAGTVWRKNGWRLAASLQARRYSGIASDTTLVAAAFGDIAGGASFTIPFERSQFTLGVTRGSGSFTPTGLASVPTQRTLVSGRWSPY